ncbi:MAG: hypothetical protein M3Y72_20110 [Acidobacteriota bacterium]|nr:hypothetical protein [Acidobacteriota bacterium]
MWFDLAQDESTARFSGMPRNVAATGAVTMFSAQPILAKSWPNLDTIVISFLRGRLMPNRKRFQTGMAISGKSLPY